MATENEESESQAPTFNFDTTIVIPYLGVASGATLTIKHWLRAPLIQFQKSAGRHRKNIEAARNRYIKAQFNMPKSCNAKEIKALKEDENRFQFSSTPVPDLMASLMREKPTLAPGDWVDPQQKNGATASANFTANSWFDLGHKPVPEKTSQSATANLLEVAGGAAQAVNRYVEERVQEVAQDPKGVATNVINTGVGASTFVLLKTLEGLGFLSKFLGFGSGN